MCQYYIRLLDISNLRRDFNEISMSIMLSKYYNYEFERFLTATLVHASGKIRSVKASHFNYVIPKSH